VRLRNKIEKASAAKQRKQRRLAKKNPEWRSRLKKDPGIPNLYPFKEKLLQEIAERKREKEEEKVRLRDEARAQRTSDAVGNVESDDDMEGDVLLDDDGNSIDDEMHVSLRATQPRHLDFKLIY
jgi:nuclear GTP-binding protein